MTLVCVINVTSSNCNIRKRHFAISMQHRHFKFRMGLWASVSTLSDVLIDLFGRPYINCHGPSILQYYVFRGIASSSIKQSFYPICRNLNNKPDLYPYSMSRSHLNLLCKLSSLQLGFCEVMLED